MKIYTKIGLIALLLATNIGTDRLSVFAKVNELPRVGVVKKSPTGAGCSFSLTESKSTAPVFVNIIGKEAMMNFDGRDTNLTRIGARSSRLNAPETYTAKNLKIKLVPRFVKKIDYTQYVDVKITISNGKKSQTIKAHGGCGC